MGNKKIYKADGFSLIELLVVLVIIGLISMTTYYFYLNNTVKSRRVQASTALNQLAIALEQCYEQNNSYENCTLENLEFIDRIANNRYQLVIGSVSKDDFIVWAIPLHDQAKQDASCGTLLLDSRGGKNITGTGKAHDCWQI